MKKKTILLPDVRQRVCELPGGPLIAVLAALEDRISRLLDKRSPSMGLDNLHPIRKAIGTAAMMHYTPRKELDPEAFAIEMRETCLAVLHCPDVCRQAFESAIEIEEENVCYAINIFAPPSADLSCLNVLDSKQIKIDIFDAEE
jgi:hypothetical protein